MEMTGLASHLSLVSYQKGAWSRVFFSEKVNFFQLEKTIWAAEKTPAVVFKKSAKDFLKTRFTP